MAVDEELYGQLKELGLEELVAGDTVGIEDTPSRVESAPAEAAADTDDMDWLYGEEDSSAPGPDTSSPELVVAQRDVGVSDNTAHGAPSGYGRRDLTPADYELLIRDMEIARLQEKLSESGANASVSRAAEPPEVEQRLWFEDAAEGLTDEEKARYGDSLSVIAKVTDDRIREALRKEHERTSKYRADTDAQLRQFATEREAFESRARRDSEARFTETINSRLPWLAGARSTSEYQQFYDGVMPNSGGLTRRQLIENAAASYDHGAVVDILSAFSGGKAEQNASVAPGRANIKPTVKQDSGRDRPITREGYALAVKKFKNGEISREAFNRIDARYVGGLVVR